VSRWSAYDALVQARSGGKFALNSPRYDVSYKANGVYEK
jgi:hypothetical protein